jgi:hypothetical protein
MQLGNVFAFVTVLFASGYVVFGSGIPAGQQRETMGIRNSFMQVGCDAPPVQKRALSEWESSFSSAIGLERRESNEKTALDSQEFSIARLKLTQETNRELAKFADLRPPPHELELKEARAILYEARARHTRTILEYGGRPEITMGYIKSFEDMIEWPEGLGPQYVGPQPPDIAITIGSRAALRLTAIGKEYKTIPAIFRFQEHRKLLMSVAHRVADIAVSTATSASIATGSLEYVTDVQGMLERPYKLFDMKPHMLNIAP